MLQEVLAGPRLSLVSPSAAAPGARHRTGRPESARRHALATRPLDTLMIALHTVLLNDSFSSHDPTARVSVHRPRVQRHNGLGRGRTRRKWHQLLPQTERVGRCVLELRMATMTLVGEY